MTKSFFSALRSLLRSTHGNGEVVGVLVCTALAVGACLVTAKVIGTKIGVAGNRLGGEVQSLAVP